MAIENFMKIELAARSVNESFARSAVAMFASQLDPTVEEISDLKTAVSEAVTNCIVHAYREQIGSVYITARILTGRRISVIIKDRGCGIEDIEQAMQPMFSTLGGERAGLGFAVMQSFTDKMIVHSRPGSGTSICFQKQFAAR